MREFFQVLNHSIDAPELANMVQKLPDHITVALSPSQYIRLACGSYCTHQASVGLAMLLFCLPRVILYDIHFFCCLMCSYLIMSCFCPSCLLFKYRYSLTKSR